MSTIVRLGNRAPEFADQKQFVFSSSSSQSSNYMWIKCACCFYNSFDRRKS